MYPRQRDLCRGIFIDTLLGESWKEKIYRLEPLLLEPEPELEELLLPDELDEELLLLLEEPEELLFTELLLELLLRLEEELTELLLLLPRPEEEEEPTELLRLLPEELRPTKEPEPLLPELELLLTLGLLLGRLLLELPELLLTEVPVLLFEDELELLPGRTDELLLVPTGLLLVEVVVPVLMLLLCPVAGLCVLVDELGRLLLFVDEEPPVPTLWVFGLRASFTDSLGLLVFGRILTELKSDVRCLSYTLRSLTLW